jgi:hypothetical protein
VHIVGLGFDPDDAAMRQGLATTRGGRGARAMEMSDQLAKVGIKDAYEGALAYVGNPELVSRTHFARFLVETGVCKDTSEVFRKYLTEGKPGYVPHRWASLQSAVQWITAGQGGMAVIAHPARYKFTANEEYALFTEFKAHGGRGVEVVTGSHTAAEAVQIRRDRARIRLGRLARQRLPQPRRKPHRPGHCCPTCRASSPGVGAAGGPHPVSARRARHRALAGIALAMAAVACFATLDTTTKFVSATVPVLMALWFRYLFQAVATTLVVLPTRGLAVLRTAHPRFQCLRGVLCC